VGIPESGLGLIKNKLRPYWAGVQMVGMGWLYSVTKDPVGMPHVQLFHPESWLFYGQKKGLNRVFHPFICILETKYGTQNIPERETKISCDF
jgi:hypothetical protein